MSYFFNFFFEKKDKEIKNGQRILHFSVNDNPTEKEYILITINKNTTCEDILKDKNNKEKIIKKLATIEGFHFSIINPENKYCELKLSKKHKPDNFLGFEYMLCFLPDREKPKDIKFREVIFKEKKIAINTNNISKDSIILNKEEILKWNPNNKKFEKVKATLTYKNIILDGINIPISNNFIYYKQFTSASSKLRENMSFSGNENFIEIKNNNQVSIYNIYNKDSYNILCRSLDEIVISNKLSNYQKYVNDILNQYILYLDFISQQPKVVKFELSYFLSNKIWRKYLGNEDPSKDKNFLNLMDMIINYKNSIRLKKYMQSWTMFIQIVSLIDIIFLNKEKPEIIKNKSIEYNEIKNQIQSFIQNLQKNNSKSITNEDLSQFFKRDLFDDLLKYIISNNFWVEIQNILYDIEEGKLNSKAIYFINLLSKYMGNLYMSTYHFSSHNTLKFNNNNGTMKAHYNLFKKLKKLNNNFN